MENRILGLTEDEFDNVKEDLDFEDDLEDFELEKTRITYEIWVLGYDEQMNATDYEYLVEADYTELVEARKHFDYILDLDNVSAFVDKLRIPDGTKHIHLFLEECMEVDDGSGGKTTECQDVVDEVEIY